jgi:hypothetical protein
MAPKAGPKTIPPAPRGFFRGPLPLPGRKPVTLSRYREAAVRKCTVKHRDQARDKWVLARNRRAQLSAGYIPPTVQPTYPMIEAPYVQAPLQITAPPVEYVEYGYGAPQIAYPPQEMAPIYAPQYAPAFNGYAPGYPAAYPQPFIPPY